MTRVWLRIGYAHAGKLGPGARADQRPGDHVPVASPSAGDRPATQRRSLRMRAVGVHVDGQGGPQTPVGPDSELLKTQTPASRDGQVFGCSPQGHRWWCVDSAKAWSRIVTSALAIVDAAGGSRL